MTNYTTLTGIHDGTRAIMSTNDGGGSSTDIIRRRASSPTQSKSPKFEHHDNIMMFYDVVHGRPEITPDKRRTDAMGDNEI